MMTDAPLYKIDLVIGVSFMGLFILACCMYVDVRCLPWYPAKAHPGVYIDNSNALPEEKASMAGELNPTYVYSYYRVVYDTVVYSDVI